MRRTLILTALGATTLSIGLGLGATLASADPAPPGPTVAATMSDRMTAGQLAGCDSAHAGLTNGQSSSVTSMSIAEHAAHHQGAQP